MRFALRRARCFGGKAGCESSRPGTRIAAVSARIVLGVYAVLALARGIGRRNSPFLACFFTVLLAGARCARRLSLIEGNRLAHRPGPAKLLLRRKANGAGSIERAPLQQHKI
jgi:hypothetical protein